MSIILRLKESIILFKGNKMQFYKTKLLKLVHIYIIYIFFKSNNSSVPACNEKEMVELPHVNY